MTHTCKMCAFYVKTEDKGVPVMDTIGGFCHRYPPTQQFGFPYVKPDDFCGEIRVSYIDPYFNVTGERK